MLNHDAVHASETLQAAGGYGPPPGPPPGGGPPGYGGPPPGGGPPGYGGPPPGGGPPGYGGPPMGGPPGYGGPPPGGYGGPPPPMYPGPMGMGPQPTGPEPNVWLPLVLSIMCIFCCWPLAIAGIVLSIIAIVKKSNGDWAGARTLSKIATIGGGIVAGLGAVFWIIYIILIAAGSVR